MTDPVGPSSEQRWLNTPSVRV